MAPDPAPGRLDGRCVLLVHGDAFQGRYLADVIARAGASVGDPVGSLSAALERLDGDPAPAALVVSEVVADAAAIARAATARQMVVLRLLRPAQPAQPWAAPVAPTPAGHALTAPFSGFQVVEALVDLLRDRAGERRPLSGPHRRGH